MTAKSPAPKIKAVDMWWQLQSVKGRRAEETASNKQKNCTQLGMQIPQKALTGSVLFFDQIGL